MQAAVLHGIHDLRVESVAAPGALAPHGVKIQINRVGICGPDVHFWQHGRIADFVVIDTPPALVFAEAQIIAAMTDAMLLVISSQDAKKREVARTRDLFNQTGLVPLGVILNKITPGSEGAYSRYYDNYASLSQ